MAISYIYTGEPMTGTAEDDAVIAYSGGTGYYHNTVNGNDGDDLVLGDSSNTWIPMAPAPNGSIASAFDLDGVGHNLWTTGENELFGDWTIPHVTAIAEATIGQAEFFRVAVGAGEQITVDIDFGAFAPFGVGTPLYAELQDSLGTVIAGSFYSAVTDGGRGSYSFSPPSPFSYDPYLTYTAVSAGDYYIKVIPSLPSAGGVFTENNTFVLNVSVTGHFTNGSNPVQGDDTIRGGNGDDALFGMGGGDRIYGEAGDDLIDGGKGFNLIFGGDGNDTIYGSDLSENVHGDNGNDTLISGGEGYYDGDAGDDVIFAGLTEQTGEFLDGGAGVDTLDTTTYGGSYAINLEFGSTTFRNERFTHFENVTTGSGHDTITGSAANNIIRTGAGDDSIAGGAGEDLLVGGPGNDTYYMDGSSDTIVELAFEGTNDRAAASVSYALGAGVYVERLTTVDDTATTAINLAGNELTNIIVGNAGANTLNGAGGDDAMIGLGGNDVYHVDAAGDVALEMAAGGNDVVYASATYVLTTGSEVETLSTSALGATAAINLTGNALAQIIYGNAGVNSLNGAGGNDTLIGLAGNDVLNGSLGNDTMNGGADNDVIHVDAAGDVVQEAAAGGTDVVYASVTYTLTAGAEVETLSTVALGATDAIDLTGNALAQIVYGNAGANVLNGLGGNDTLVGLGGADSFAFTTALGAGNVDAISGFSVADDTILLENAVFTGLAAGALAAGAFNTGASASQADDRIVYNAASGALLFDADGSGAGAAVQFATLAGGLALTASDFIVI